MNREILFRGKSGDGWHYGLLTKYGNHKWRVIEEDNNMVTVKTNTIGQYTGLTDKNGVKIFAGDILQDVNTGEYVVVQWFSEHSSFMVWRITINTIDFLYSFLYPRKLKVVGNVYDGQNLIDKEKEGV